jgi:hypothetical protein
VVNRKKVRDAQVEWWKLWRGVDELLCHLCRWYKLFTSKPEQVKVVRGREGGKRGWEATLHSARFHCD